MKKIMVVEDDQALGNALKTKLEIHGYETIWAKDGENVFDLINPEIELIFLDIIMPGLDGFEVLRKLKSPDSEFRTIPVVMLTNQSDISEIDKALENGATDYIIKSNMKIENVVLKAEKIIGTP